MTRFAVNAATMYISCHNIVSFLGKSALQILPCLSLSVCVCVCVCVCYLCVNVFSQVAKIQKKSPTETTFLVEWHISRFSPPWSWPSFSRSTFWHIINLRMSRKWWEMEQTLLQLSDRKSCIFYRMAPLLMLYIMILTNVFKVTDFEMKISQKQWELAKNTPEWLYRGWYLPSKWTIAFVVLRDLDLHFES